MPRPLTPADLDAIDALRPEDWLPYRKTFEHYFALPGCHPWGFEDAGRLVAMGTLVSFGATGWLAQVITEKASQGKGWGFKVVNHLVEEALNEGIDTLSLVATEQGFPLYEKAGFRVEGDYAFWVRSEPAPAEPDASAQLVPWSPGDSRTILAMDRQVSGEDREYYLGRDIPHAWMVRDEGYFLPSLGEGLVVASTEAAGIPLLHRRIDGTARVVVPVENRWAPAVLASRGFAEEKRIRRMVLGPSLQRKPQWCWSRIAGNVG